MSTPATETPLSSSAIDQVAEAENCGPMDLAVPLYEVIDPDCLDALPSLVDEDQHSTLRVAFEYYGHTVIADSSGSVMLADESPFTETSEITQD